MMKKTKKKHVQNNDLSHPISKSNKKKSIFAIVELTICVACILFLTIPFIKIQDLFILYQMDRICQI